MPLIRPIGLRDANSFVAQHHRHHKPSRGHRFSLAAWDDGTLVGVAIMGRPVSRNFDHNEVLEVARLCTDGSRNACSFLYSAAARVAKEMDYTPIQTSILDSAMGTAIKGSGWKYTEKVEGRVWNCPSRGGR